MRVLGTRQWPISLSCMDYLVNKSLFKAEALVVRARGCPIMATLECLRNVVNKFKSALASS